MLVGEGVDAFCSCGAGHRASTTASHLQLVRYGTVTPLYSSVN
jgi:hypothetical protein